MAKVGDLVRGTVKKLAGRVDAQAEAPRYIRDAVLELTESYDFEELKTTGPAVQFTVGKSNYDPKFFTNGNDEATNIDSWFVILNSSTAGNLGRCLKYRTIMVVEPMTKISGPPSRWSRYGNELLVGNCPDQAYSTYMRYQKKHPFEGDYFNIDTLKNQELLVPDVWLEIIEYGAAERGAIELRMMDYATTYHSLLYGDPEFQVSGGTRGTPGLIFKRTSQMERDMGHNERQLQPRVDRYTN